MQQTKQIRSLINRLARLDASQSWDGVLNPAQRAALDYLARANRFSRSPSHAAEFLGTTRGTTSQTLKSLLRKGFVSEARSDTDKRSISYDVTDKGQLAADAKSPLLEAFDALPADDLTLIEASLERLLNMAVRKNGSKPFGVCHTCRHFEPRKAGGYCKLLHVALEGAEIDQICHEQEPAQPAWPEQQPC